MKELSWGPSVASGGAILASPKPQTIKNPMHDNGGINHPKSRQSNVNITIKQLGDDPMAGGKRGSKFAAGKLESLAETIKELVPTSSTEWERV
jgi:hypothetical protein